MSDQEQELTKIEQDVLELMKTEYVEHGWAHSGCVRPDWSALLNCNTEGDAVWRAVDHLIQLGYVQRRNCQALAYELTPAQRWQLIEGYDLNDYWQMAGQGPGGDEYYEITHVRSVVEKGTSNV